MRNHEKPHVITSSAWWLGRTSMIPASRVAKGPKGACWCAKDTLQSANLQKVEKCIRDWAAWREMSSNKANVPPELCLIAAEIFVLFCFLYILMTQFGMWNDCSSAWRQYGFMMREQHYATIGGWDAAMSRMLGSHIARYWRNTKPRFYLWTLPFARIEIRDYLL